MATDDAVAPVLSPARAREVAAHHAFGVDPLRAPDEHRPPVDVGIVGCARELRRIRREEMGGPNSRERLEPPRGEAGQHPSFVRDRLVEHHVECGEAVGCDQQQPLVVDSIGLAHLAAVHQRQAGDLAPEQRHEASSDASVSSG
jgi:hypothetical protein